ncbi:hypothetical protein ABIC65_001094 [Sphingomonas trueperi]|uniref:hypothetical protein n=1 Tax=Sphingomonas trueperi TaxID=53317 RepID=UPI00339A8D7A
MSYPTEIDFAVVKIGDGASPETFPVVCGIQNAAVNQTVQTSDQQKIDCAKPGKKPTRTVRVTGSQWDVTGSGVTSVEQFPALQAALGKRRNIQIVALRDDGTDEGEELGTFEGQGVLTALNINMQRDSGTMEVTIAGENDLTWTPAA